MSFEVREVTSAGQFADTVQVQADAFDAPLSVSSQIFYPVSGSNPNDRKNAIKGLICREWFHQSIDPECHRLAVIDTDNGNKVIAGATWGIVKSHTGDSPAIDPFWLPEGELKEFAKGIFKIWAELNCNREPHVGKANSLKQCSEHV